MTAPIITPKTKIFDLLETYPMLEDILISKAPEFKRLKNPLLRKTIARVTTLAQVATIGGIAVDALINELRAQVGEEATCASQETGNTYTTAQPAWFNPGDVQETFDAGTLLNRGEHPVHEVLSKLKKLDDDEILELITPFIPAPLIDKASSLGYNHWLKQETDGSWHIYFKRELPIIAEEMPVEDNP